MDFYLLFILLKGAILLHDLSNKNSYDNLYQWASECFGNGYQCKEINNYCALFEGCKNRGIVSVVGNKKDKISTLPTQTLNNLPCSITTSSLDMNGFLPSTLEGDKMKIFIEQTIMHRFSSSSRTLYRNNIPKNTSSGSFPGLSSM